MLQRFKRILKLGLVNFVRNWSLSIAAILMTCLTLLTITVFVMLNLAGQTTTNLIKQKIDMVAYFDDKVPEQEIEDIRLKISSRFNVTEAKYISKDEAQKIWQERPVSDQVKQLITADDNPLPRSLQIKAQDADTLNEIAQILSSEKFQGKVYKVSYQENKQVIERLLNITKFVNITGSLLSLVFIIISIIVIYNTIRLTIFSRKEEIEIMELVGASSIFVRLPFIIEAILYGLIATILALAILILGFKLFSPVIVNYLGFIGFDLKNYVWDRLWLMVVLQLSVGIVISIVSSYITVRKYLK